MPRSPSRHRITVEEYHRMAEVGLLAPDARVELIEGEIIDMAPIGNPHNSAVDMLNQRLTLAVSGQAIVRVQGSFRLSGFTEPQPDVILLKPSDDFYWSRFATGDDTLLVIEVSDSTFRYDGKVKAPLYARYGIPEYWIVEIEQARWHFLRSPVDGQYTDESFTDTPGVTELPGLSGKTVDLGKLLKS
ncbi:MAG: Uma2 family endonuclease [Steroidobacterales bacterium]